MTRHEFLGRGVLPSQRGLPTHPQVAELAKEILFWDPRDHTGDRLAALLFARWGAEQGSMKVEQFYWNHLR